jgi:hypothetical protein
MLDVVQYAIAQTAPQYSALSIRTLSHSLEVGSLPMN